MTTPEEYESLLHSLCDKDHNEAKVTVASYSAGSDAADLWYKQQHERELEERQRRAEAASKLHQYRGSTTGCMSPTKQSKNVKGGDGEKQKAQSDKIAVEKERIGQKVQTGANPSSAAKESVNGTGENVEVYDTRAVPTEENVIEPTSSPDTTKQAGNLLISDEVSNGGECTGESYGSQASFCIEECWA